MVAPSKVTFEFNRELRLLTPGQFQQVFSNTPLRFGSNHFTVLAYKNSEHHPRVGFAIAKKRIKHAVQRNRIKRLVRESFRLIQHQLPDIDLVFMAKSGADQLDNTEVTQQVEKIWRKIIQRHNG